MKSNGIPGYIIRIVGAVALLVGLAFAIDERMDAKVGRATLAVERQEVSILTRP